MEQIRWKDIESIESFVETIDTFNANLTPQQEMWFWYALHCGLDMLRDEAVD